MGKFIGPGYVRVGPVTAGVFGVGCLVRLAQAGLVALLVAILVVVFV